MDPSRESLPGKPSADGRILYSSFQAGPSLPPYVRYALASLAQSGLAVTLLTNRRELDEDSLAFLNSHAIELFLTENDGFDFGMWRRYLNATPDTLRAAWSRLLLINDSVVYFRDVLPDFIARAESADADMVSLTANPNLGFHLQSFFLYLKPRAIQQLSAHLEESAAASAYWDTVRTMEVGLSRRMEANGLRIAPLFQTAKHIDFSYEELIRRGAGFVKRRFIDRRYYTSSPHYFWKNNERRAVELDYIRLIRESGNPDPAFPLDSLHTMVKTSPIQPVLYRLKRLGFLAFFPAIRALRRYCRFATPRILALDLLALLFCASVALIAGRIYGWPAALAGFLTAALLVMTLRRMRRRA
ncbi:MAG: hypothetical protein M9963_06250 [Kiritimatiellae bacterium]|nr:hypothetical protein [Kiritimatiellia bacterium]